MNDQIRALLDRQRRAQEDKLAQQLHYRGQLMQPPTPYVSPQGQLTSSSMIAGPRNVKDFMAQVESDRQARAQLIQNVPPEMDSIHRLAFSRQIGPARNESGSHRGIYGF